MNTAMDVVSTDQAFEVKMDLPGVDAKDVDIQVENNILTVPGQRNEEREEKDEARRYHRIVRDSGSFCRSAWLPNAVNEDEAVAEFRSGVFKVAVPKAEGAKPRKINIKSRWALRFAGDCGVDFQKQATDSNSPCPILLGSLRSLPGQSISTTTMKQQC